VAQTLARIARLPDDHTPSRRLVSHATLDLLVVLLILIIIIVVVTTFFVVIDRFVVFVCSSIGYQLNNNTGSIGRAVVDVVLGREGTSRSMPGGA
jgi:hypothetical protein